MILVLYRVQIIDSLISSALNALCNNEALCESIVDWEDLVPLSRIVIVLTHHHKVSVLTNNITYLIWSAYDVATSKLTDGF